MQIVMSTGGVEVALANPNTTSAVLAGLALVALPGMPDCMMGNCPWLILLKHHPHDECIRLPTAMSRVHCIVQGHADSCTDEHGAG